MSRINLFYKKQQGVKKKIYIFLFIRVADDNGTSSLGCLESEEQHESHHETEKTHGLGQRKAKNGIGKELLLKTWIASVANHKTAKDCTNTSAFFCFLLIE